MIVGYMASNSNEIWVQEDKDQPKCIIIVTIKLQLGGERMFPA